MPAVRRKDTRMDTLLSAPMGFLSGLEAQGEIKELLDELYGDGRREARSSSVADPTAPVYGGPSELRETPNPTRRGRRTTPWMSTRGPLRRGCRGSPASRRATPAGWHAAPATIRTPNRPSAGPPPRHPGGGRSFRPATRAWPRKGLPGPPSAPRTPKAEPLRSRPQASRSDGPLS